MKHLSTSLELNAKLGKLFRDEREKQHLTQLEVSRYLGYDSTQFVSLFERGLSKIPYSVIGKLCTLYGVKKERVLGMILKDIKDRVIAEMDRT